jgi:hypothetical protein
MTMEERAAGVQELTRSELEQLVQELAAEPERWQELVRHDPGQRVYMQLARDAVVDVWLICWLDDHDTGFHDHDVSSGAVAVVQGQLCEQRLALGRAPVSRIYGPGEVFSFDASHVHRMRHAGEAAVSIHAYSPPLWRMGAYSVEGDGTLRRRSISYAEELRPLEAADTAA